MNEDAPKDPVSEADTTPPNPSNGAVPSPGQGWQMPEPKFQQSSGYLPQGYLDKVAFSPSAIASPAAPAPAAAPEPTRRATLWRRWRNLGGKRP